MDPEQFLQDGTVRIATETYAVCQADEGHPDAFATIQDDTETTVVVEESEAEVLDTAQVKSGWKRLTFEMELPFELVGFLGTVATALAEADVSVFVLSSYSTDHVFVDETDLADAVTRLEALGCRISYPNETQ